MLEETYGRVYAITNLVNGKKYVGQTTQNIHYRFTAHKNMATLYNKNGLLHRAIRKYGINNFFIKELAVARDKDQLDLLECEFIIGMGSMVPTGYNVKGGGSYGRHSEETKEKIRQTSRRVQPDLHEYRGKLLTLRELHDISTSQHKVRRETIGYRIKRGWPIEEAVNAPYNGFSYLKKQSKRKISEKYEYANKISPLIEIYENEPHHPDLSYGLFRRRVQRSKWPIKDALIITPSRSNAGGLARIRGRDV